MATVVRNARNPSLTATRNGLPNFSLRSGSPWQGYPGPRRTLATESAASSRLLRMIILGAPGSGKGTLGGRLIKKYANTKYDIVPIGVGNLLRQEIASGSDLGREAESYIKRGALAPDQLCLRLVETEVDKLKNQNWILDGYPRTGYQCVLLDESLANRKEALNLVVNLKVPDSVILERIENRWIHTPSGRIYNTTFNPPKVPGKDDLTGEPLSKRPDDNVDVFRKRLEVFHAENNSILQHYDDQRLVHLSGNTSDEIWPDLDRVVEDHLGIS